MNFLNDIAFIYSFCSNYKKVKRQDHLNIIKVASQNDARGVNSFVADFLKVHSQSIFDFCPNKYVSSFLLKLKDICTIIFAFRCRCFATTCKGVMTI